MQLTPRDLIDLETYFIHTAALEVWDKYRIKYGLSDRESFEIMGNLGNLVYLDPSYLNILRVRVINRLVF